MAVFADEPDFEAPDLRTAHVIVVGNEKGGTGKSTLSIHISVALLKAGFRVATIDLDTRQRTPDALSRKPPLLGGQCALGSRTALPSRARARHVRQSARQ